jgi:hypothetical protein
MHYGTKIRGMAKKREEGLSGIESELGLDLG